LLLFFFIKQEWNAIPEHRGWHSFFNFEDYVQKTHTHRDNIAALILRRHGTAAEAADAGDR
jgi:hypothetical protein